MPGIGDVAGQVAGRDQDHVDADVSARRGIAWGEKHGGGGYAAPAENVRSFLEGAGTLHTGVVKPTYPRGVTACDLGSLLPGELTGALRAGLSAFERKLRGYTAPEAVLTGLETRTSSPVRLARGDGLQSPELLGVYPCGEGAGYAGGITSAALDGILTAEAVIEAQKG